MVHVIIFSHVSYSIHFCHLIYNEKGEVVKYEPSYVIKFDEDVNGEIHERRLKFPLTNKVLYNKLDGLEVYSKIALVCDVQLFTGNAKVLPIDIKTVSPVTNAINSGLNTLVPIGIGIMGTFIGIALIKRVIYTFL